MAYCIHCGAELEEDSRFCTSCGAPVGSDAPSGGNAAVQPGGNGGAPAASSKGTNRALIVAIVLLAVGAVVLAIFVFVYFSSQNSGNADSAPTTAEQAKSDFSSNLPSGGAPAAPSSDASSLGAGTASSGSGSHQSSSSSTVALSASDDYKLINTFLSNFTEYPYWDYDTFTASNLSDTDLALFAAYHTGINSPSLVEEPGGSSNDFGVGSGAAAGGGCNQRITKARVQEVCQRYFGRNCDLGNVSADGYHYSDGYLYWGITAPYTPAGVACVSSVSDLGNNRYDVRFHLLGADGGYDSSSSSLYSLPEQKMASTIGAARTVPCKAVVVASTGNDGKKTLTLESYGLDY